MNRSRYVTRHLDGTDRAIVARLTQNGRMTVRELANHIGLSCPSVTERIHKLEDAGAIRGYSTIVDPKAFGLHISAYVRMRAIPGESRKLIQLLADTPQIVEADRVTGEDSFVAKMVVRDIPELESVIDGFHLIASTDTAIVQSSPVVRRLPKL